MMKIFAVHDSAVGSYGKPFFAKSTGEAIRSFTDAVKAKDSLLGQHPEHFSLFAVGEWDEDTADIKGYKVHIALMKAMEVSNENI